MGLFIRKEIKRINNILKNSNTNDVQEAFYHWSKIIIDKDTDTSVWFVKLLGCDNYGVQVRIGLQRVSLSGREEYILSQSVKKMYQKDWKNKQKSLFNIIVKLFEKE